MHMPAVVGAAGKTEHLQREYGKDTGHEIENCAAGESQQHHVEQGCAVRGAVGPTRASGSRRATGLPGCRHRRGRAGDEINVEGLRMRGVAQAGVGTAL